MKHSQLLQPVLGKVHKAVLKNGKAIAIKVQRNNLDFIVKQDLALLYFLIRLIKFLRPDTDWQNWNHLIDEFGNTLFAEMDYLQEGRNADRLRATLRYFPAVIIPRVFWLYTTKRIITEELCLGTKIDKLSLLTNVDLKRLAQNIVKAYLAQIIDDSYFHADPHAGNLAVNTYGQLIIYDFGMMGYITDKQKQGLNELIFSIAKNDISLFLDCLSHLGFIDAHRRTDKNLQKVIEKIWTNFHLPSKKEIDLVQLEKEVDLLLLKRYFRLPANLAYLIRMAVALEAIVYRLDPELNFLKMAKPYFKKDSDKLRYNLS